MATISSNKFVGTKHWSDPAAWVGGVVPTGSGDVAVIESGFTQINEGNGVRVWTGSRSTVRVDSTAGFPDTSGSFYAYTYQTADYVKIDYDLRQDDDFFVSCSVDHSYVSWSNDESGSLDDGKAYGTLRNNAPVFRTDHTYICMSGSSEWHINRVIVRDHACFEIKDTATLKLDSTSQDAYVEVQDAKFLMKDQTTAILTGSTERNSSLIHSKNSHYQQIIISGSSDLRSRTTISSNVQTGSGVIPVASATDFAVGDLISLYSENDVFTQKTNRTGSNDEYYPYYYDVTGSIFPYVKSTVVSNQDEVMYIRSINGNNLNVSKMFSTYGQVISSSATITKREWQRSHGRSKSKFTGSKTKIQVRSSDNSFEAGNKVLIGNSVYTVLEAGDVLIHNKTYDFTAGANLDDFYVDSNIGSGSDNQYKIHADLITGSRFEMSGSIVGSNNHYKSVFLKDFRMRDLKVTMTGSLLRQETNSYGSSGDFNSSRMIGISIHACPYERDKVLPFYSRPLYSRDTFIGAYHDDVLYGSRTDNYGAVDSDKLIESSSITSGMREGDVTFAVENLRETQKYFFQGLQLNEGLKRNKAGTVGLHLRREGSCIKKVVIEEYVQELVLDTTDSISVNSFVFLTGTEVFHPSGQHVVKIASGITDLRGYKNIPAQYTHDQPITNAVVPCHLSNDGDTDLHRNSNTTSNQSRMPTLFYNHQHYDYYYRVRNSGDAFFDMNLGQDVTLDAIGILFYYTMPSHYNQATVDRIGLQYSSDGSNWSTALANQADTRLSSQAGDYRIYSFTEITARFLRIHVSGTSASQTNNINAFGFYHFNNRGNTIELNSTKDINVNDTIAFMNPTGHRGAGYISNQLQGNYRANVLNGSKNMSDYVGGGSMLYTVTAKSGNVITVDRKIEGFEIKPDTLVIKMNRAITVKSNAGNNNLIPFGFWYADSGTAQRKMHLENVFCPSLGSNSRERMYFYAYPNSTKQLVANCSFYYVDPQSIYANGAGHIRKNNAWINVRAMSNIGSRMYSDTKIHGEIATTYNWYFRGVHSQKNYYSGNVVDSGRYLYINSHSTPYSPNTAFIEIRNNYFVYMDYYNHYIADNNGMEQTAHNFVYYDNIERQGGGYNRYYKTHTRTQVSKHNRVEGNRHWPTVYPNAHVWRTEMNLQYYSAMGSDYLTLEPYYDQTTMGRRPYLVDNGRRLIITNKENRNQYDIFSISNNRVDAFLAAATFQVHSAQQIRVQQKMTFKNDFGYFYDNYLNSNPEHHRNHLKGFIIYNDRTIAGQGQEKSLTFTNFSFDHTFTAQPGNYLYMLMNRNREINMRTLTFKDMSFSVTGDTPNDIEISSNGFETYKILKRPDRIVQNTYLGNLRAPKRLATRNVIKLRKFKF